MRRFKVIGLLTAFALGASSVFAADAITSNAPALPDFAGNSSLPDMTLPGLDLPEPNATASTPVAATTAPVPATPTTVPDVAPPPAAVPAAATPTAVVAVASPAPADVVASPTVVAEVVTPTAVPATAAPASASVEKVGVVLQGLEAYFPMTAGTKWSYSTSTGQTRVVECQSRDDQSASFCVTTANVPVTQAWKISGGKIILAADTVKLRAGWVRLVTPQGKVIPRWTYDRRDGTASYYKQEVGPVKAGGKEYADGLTVTERALKGTEQVSLRKWFYAKGVGLVMDATYDAAGAVVPGKTFELQAAQ
jgi:hypothetical protein